MLNSLTGGWHPLNNRVWVETCEAGREIPRVNGCGDELSVGPQNGDTSTKKTMFMTSGDAGIQGARLAT